MLTELQQKLKTTEAELQRAQQDLSHASALKRHSECSIINNNIIMAFLTYQCAFCSDISNFITYFEYVVVEF